MNARFHLDFSLMSLVRHCFLNAEDTPALVYRCSGVVFATSVLKMAFSVIRHFSLSELYVVTGSVIAAGSLTS